MADDVPIVAEDDEQLQKRRPQAIPVNRERDAPPLNVANANPSAAVPLTTATPQTAKPIPVLPSGKPYPVGRVAGIPGYENPPTAESPLGSVTPPHPVGVAQLASKAENIHNPFLRSLAKVGAYGARALDTAGTILAPRITEAIPGTTMNQAVKVGAQQRQEAEQTKEGLEKAETHNQEAEAIERENAGPKLGTPEEQTFAYLLTQTDPETKKPYTPMAAFSAAQQAKQDVKPKAEGEKPVTDSNQINQINAERAQQWHVMHPEQPLDPSYMAKVGDTEKSIKEQDERFGRFGSAEGTQATRDATQAQRDQTNQSRSDAKTDREAAKNTALKEKAITYWQPALDSAERVNVMAKNYREGVDDHNQQAMLSMLANHLGMTMGLQKGARLNQAIIAEAEKSAPWLQGMKAKFDDDGYLSGVTLTPEQMKQMLDLGFERYREDVKKARSMANYIGVTDEPPRHISKDSARYYVEGVGGDAAKARQMATEDGWQF